ncbi:unnamed protein product [Rotaria socialis]|uniref:Uncharacterized protein n=3 Tax=Rotaria socialis TaxID=392032 RepID=A0A818NR15_9BILA|nr:unnamed protein product [Rotaria socialis]
MESQSSSVTPVAVESQGGESRDASPSSTINYAAATTAGNLDQHARRPYPPLNRVGPVAANDRPFLKYGNQDKLTIARNNNFDLAGKETESRRKSNKSRMHTKAFAITCWTNVSNGDYVEFGEFRDTGSSSQQYGPGMPNDPSIGNTSNATTSGKPMTVRAQAEEFRKRKNEIADTALTIAETSVPKAMKYVRKKLPYVFMDRSENCQKSFTYVHNEAQQQHRGAVEKEFCWDLSFPNCTPRIHAVVSHWLLHEFRNPNRPKCLIIIGLSGTGKTAFAQSLPGLACYFKGRWCLNVWKENAQYLIFDDIPWDAFKDESYPNKKNLLSANGETGVTDKYKGSTTINVTMPSIVLLNPGDTGSLMRTPVTAEEKDDAHYWSRRAVVLVMGPDEFFHRPEPPSASNTTGFAYNGRPLLGHDNEFEDNRRVFLAGQERRRRAAAAAAATTTTAVVVNEPVLQSSPTVISQADSNLANEG